MDILEEAGMTKCKPVNTPMVPSIKLLTRQRKHYQILNDIEELLGN